MANDRIAELVNTIALRIRLHADSPLSREQNEWLCDALRGVISEMIPLDTLRELSDAWSDSQTRRKASTPHLRPASLIGFYSVEDISARFQLPTSQILELCERRQMPHYTLAGVGPYFRLSEVNDWFKSEMVYRHVAVKTVKTVRVMDFMALPKSESMHLVPKELIALDNLLEVPLSHAIPGVYFLCRDGAVVYVGSSINVIARIGTHVREGVKQFSSAFYLPAQEAQMFLLEGEFAKKLRPQYNLSGDRVVW